MDWNIKFWDWENQNLFNGKESESSISASIVSSSKSEVKITGFDFDSVDDFSIGLKLGKRTYFEDVCAGNYIKNSTSSTTMVPSTASVKKNRITQQSISNSRCQVEGCNVDLSGAKDYHRKHRVCESHSKCDRVIVDGQVCRFCQQCSRFHDLSEFDQRKRSCRKRLSDHNARRRKPQPDVISFNSSRLASPFCDVGRQEQIGVGDINRYPFADMVSSSTACGFSLTHLKAKAKGGSWNNPTRPGLKFSNSDLSIVPALNHDLDKLLPVKDTNSASLLTQDVEASIMHASNFDWTPRVYSLLSTDSWGSSNPDHSDVTQYGNMNHNDAVDASSASYLHYLSQQEQVLAFEFNSNNGKAP